MAPATRLLLLVLLCVVLIANRATLHRCEYSRGWLAWQSICVVVLQWLAAGKCVAIGRSFGVLCLLGLVVVIIVVIRHRFRSGIEID